MFTRIRPKTTSFGTKQNTVYISLTNKTVSVCVAKKGMTRCSRCLKLIFFREMTPPLYKMHAASFGLKIILVTKTRVLSLSIRFTLKA